MLDAHVPGEVNLNPGGKRSTFSGGGHCSGSFHRTANGALGARVLQAFQCKFNFTPGIFFLVFRLSRHYFSEF